MSRPQVTITLGRSGQVVKRAGNALNDSRFASSALSGSKRSIRERLGGNADSFLAGSQSNVKRQRGESNGNSNGLQDLQVKLVQKNKAKQINDMNIKHDNTILCGNVSMVKPSPSPLRHHMHGAYQGSSLRRVPPTRSANDLLQLNSVRKSYSSWDGQRRGSPDRIAGAPRELSLRYGSPDRRVGASRGHLPLKLSSVQPQVLAYRPVEVSRVSSYAGKDVYDHAGPMVRSTALSLEATRPITHQHHQSSTLQNNSHLDPLTIGNFLSSLGLGKYTILFQAEEIDMTVLKHMQDNDLKELGIPMGPRRKILLSLLSLSRRI